MPKVAVDPTKYERKELKSAPADPADPTDEQGFVMVRPLPYGLTLTRRDKASKMKMQTEDKRSRGNRNKGGEPTAVVELETLNEWAVAHDFAYCIGEHNLQYADGQLIDFTNPMCLQLLDPRVGQEIEAILDEINGGPTEEELEDFMKQHGSSPSVSSTNNEPGSSVA